MRLLLVALAIGLSACGSGSAARTIDVDMVGSKFVPAEFTVTAGETVVFSLDNRDAVDHEMVIGDQAAQKEHAEAGPGNHGHMEGAATVSARRRGLLRYTFPDEPTELILGCHIDDHYEQGMKGTVRVVRG